MPNTGTCNTFLRAQINQRCSRFSVYVARRSVKRAESYHVERWCLCCSLHCCNYTGCTNTLAMATSALLLEQCVSYQTPFASPMTRHRPRFIVHALAARRIRRGCGRHSSQRCACVNEQMQIANGSDTASEQGRLLDRTPMNRRSLGVAALILSLMTPLQTLAGE